MEVRYKVGIGLSIMLCFSIFVASAFLSSRPGGSANSVPNFLTRARRSDDNEDSVDSKLRFDPVKVVHHAVHSEVNSHVGLESLLKAAAENKAENDNLDSKEEETQISTDSDMPEVPDDRQSIDEENYETENQAENLPEYIEPDQSMQENMSQMNMMMSAPQMEIELPEFSICPINPELPGESGSIRKVRDTERAKVDQRISEKLHEYRNNSITGCTSDCHVGCPDGTFRLPGMTQCKPRLNCNQIKKMLPTKDRFLIGGGGVKRIYTADLQGNAVVIARVKRFKFNQYLDSMIELQQTGIVAQLVGMCEEPAWPEVVLQYHSLGSLLSVAQMPSDLDLRWRVVMSYLDVVEKLHNKVPRSPRVLCDASRTEITLSQFLLTDDFRVVLNDVDELIAASNDGKVRCNCNIIRGGSEFSGEGMGCLVPPEQKKCGTNVFYTEKIDIWKIPDITAAILGKSDDSLNLWNHLYHIHQECKLDDPLLRPPIEHVVAKYRQVQAQFNIETGL